MSILPRGMFAERGEIVVDLSFGEISLIFLINGIIHLWVINFFLIQKMGVINGVAGGYRMRFLVFFMLQAMLHVAWSEYKNMALILFLIAIFLFVLFVLIFLDENKNISILNFFSFGVNLIFANIFDLSFLLIFALLSQLLICFFFKRKSTSE